jgi:TPR repeat protein
MDAFQPVSDTTINQQSYIDTTFATDINGKFQRASKEPVHAKEIFQGLLYDVKKHTQGLTSSADIQPFYTQLVTMAMQWSTSEPENVHLFLAVLIDEAKGNKDTADFIFAAAQTVANVNPGRYLLGMLFFFGIGEKWGDPVFTGLQRLLALSNGGYLPAQEALQQIDASEQQWIRANLSPDLLTLFYAGASGIPDCDKKAAFFRQAATNGYVSANFLFAQAYRVGSPDLGIDPDPSKSESYFTAFFTSLDGSIQECEKLTSGQVDELVDMIEESLKTGNQEVADRILAALIVTAFLHLLENCPDHPHPIIQHIQGAFAHRKLLRRHYSLELNALGVYKRVGRPLGHAWCQLLDVVKHLERNNAYSGHRVATYLLGMSYLGTRDDSVRIDKLKALEYLKQSADLGFQPAMDQLKVIAADLRKHFGHYQISVFYEEGKYVKADPDMALLYLRKGAKQNDPQALFKLSLIHLDGNSPFYSNVIPDRTTGLRYLVAAAYQPIDEETTIAAKTSIVNAAFVLATWCENNPYWENIFDKGSSSVVAAHCLHIATRMNHPDAAFRLGKAYFYGDDSYLPLKRHLKNAINCLFAVAHQTVDSETTKKRVAEANSILFALCEKKPNLPQFTPAELSTCLHLLAEKKHPEALLRLGKSYLHGDPLRQIRQDLNKAIDYLTQAVNHGTIIGTTAAFILAKIYETRLDASTENRDKALLYYKLAKANPTFNQQAHFKHLQLAARENRAFMFELGEYYLDRGKIKKAKQCFQEVANLSKNNKLTPGIDVAIPSKVNNALDVRVPYDPERIRTSAAYLLAELCDPHKQHHDNAAHHDVTEALKYYRIAKEAGVDVESDVQRLKILNEQLQRKDPDIVHSSAADLHDDI